ncbi:FlaD/FlaE family flagellar protein [Salinigranum marinum]|uniref:FlaD/FlaE family flagellar protein n=1 Tax=Salinigranum marinum TaxID=1515595 RepID=UPI002989C5BF|nr:FlaD/FlaE family flagellar protein [Salinigranum marinum]
MNVNPEDYDPEELRQMAAERRAVDRPEGRRGDADDPTPHADDTGSRRGDDPAPRHTDESAPRRNGVDGRRGPRGRFGGGSRVGPRPDRGPATNGRGNPEPTRGPAADALRSNQLEQLFLHQSATIAEEMTKPYLGSIPQKYAAERVIFDWLEFLVLKGGFKRTMDALRYYRTIDWITEDVESSLQDYLIGFSDEGTGSHDLNVDDHQLSLVYVARLASMS